nr:hypothetical protein [Tanacetum cinerariifolium]
MSEKKVITKPIDYAVLNQLSKDFKTRFVPHAELSAEQAFWSRYSVQSKEPNLSVTTTIVEVPKELPKVSMEEELEFLADPGIAETSKVYNQDNVYNNVLYQDVQETSTSEQSNILNQSETKIPSDSNIISYSQYMNDSQYTTV